MGMKDWLEFFSNNGLALTIIAIMLTGTVIYGPRLIKAHLSFVESAKLALDSMPIIEEKRLVRFDIIGDEHGQQLTEIQKTNRALDRACDMIEVCCTGSENAAEIRQHTVEIRKALRG